MNALQWIADRIEDATAWMFDRLFDLVFGPPETWLDTDIWDEEDAL